ncbi:nucleotide-sugar transmembrane transporter [Holotrichia oblita]|uniref:Nucleotide-sugar transmembrane transporter n=1 Tax=Holotrichia oblita TaxID=644536 RepID=A0ACB9SRJ3_HOLOL|nr:nucleotide-sugar transmembrane transporter [Holotrichia oblita]
MNECFYFLDSGSNTLKYVSLVTLTVQNALLGLSMRYREPERVICFYLRQVTYQMKILTTAMFAVIILKRQLLRTQWFSLVTLVLGVVLVQLAQTSEQITSGHGPHQNKLLGFSAALSACCLSGFAGIYFEKMLKGSDISVWMRNVQLSLCSLPFGLLTCFITDNTVIKEKGFFFGYDKFILYLILLQAGGGLIVAVVVKYADNILKGFATSLAIVISCVASVYIFSFQLTFQFSVGALFVIFSIFLYGYVPTPTTVATTYKV